jgi:hypothetical protein
MSDPQRQISPDRKALFYIGHGLSLVGLLLFMSNFCIVASAFGNMPQDGPGFMQGFIFRAVGGMVLIGVGQVISNVGKRGLAGAGLIPDAEQQRKDLEPWSRSTGGMINDALSEVQSFHPVASAPEIRVRCPRCKALNEETAKFCDQCGGKLI